MECLFCKSNNISREFKDFPFTQLNTDTVILHNVEVLKCLDCGEEYYELPSVNELINNIREKLCFLNRTINGGEFETLRLGLDLNGQECAKLLSVTNVSISRWENGVVPVHSTADKMLRALTLGELGYAQNRIVSLLQAVEENGVDTVEIDLIELENSVAIGCEIFSASDDYSLPEFHGASTSPAAFCKRIGSVQVGYISTMNTDSNSKSDVNVFDIQEKVINCNNH